MHVRHARSKVIALFLLALFSTAVWATFQEADALLSMSDHLPAISAIISR